MGGPSEQGRLRLGRTRLCRPVADGEAVRVELLDRHVEHLGVVPRRTEHGDDRRGNDGVGDEVSVNHPVEELGIVMSRTRKVVCAAAGSVRVAKNRGSKAPLALRSKSAKATVLGKGLVAVISVQVIERSTRRVTVQDAPT